MVPYGLLRRNGLTLKLIREDFERCHAGETLEDLKRRALLFSKGG
jgi:hypothetical protein